MLFRSYSFFILYAPQRREFHSIEYRKADREFFSGPAIYLSCTPRRDGFPDSIRQEKFCSRLKIPPSSANCPASFQQSFISMPLHDPSRQRFLYFSFFIAIVYRRWQGHYLQPFTCALLCIKNTLLSALLIAVMPARRKRYFIAFCPQPFLGRKSPAFRTSYRAHACPARAFIYYSMPFPCSTTAVFPDRRCV